MDLLWRGDQKAKPSLFQDPITQIHLAISSSIYKTSKIPSNHPKAARYKAQAKHETNTKFGWPWQASTTWPNSWVLR